MTGMVTYAGLDVHARSTHAAAIDVHSGEIVRARFGPGVEGPVQWLKGLPGPVRACYEASYGGDQTFATECITGTPPTITLVPSTVPEGATFAGDPDTIVKVSANGLETYVEEFNSLESGGPGVYPAAWETTLSAEATLEQVGVVEPECVDPFFGGPLIVARKFVATNAAGSADSGWIETHSVYCYPE